MSLEINQIALHQLIKRDEQTLEVVLRDSLLEPTATVVEMMAELHRVYSAKNKAYGLFSDESELADSLRLQRQGEEDFLAFSRAATGRLRDELAKYPFADGGIVLFCHYRYLAVEYLLVTVLNNLSSMRVNEQLDISSTHYLDINHADIVARIDLTEWETNPESTRYLTFLKGRVGRKVADFFMDFLGASEGLNAKAQNKGLLQAVDDFTAEAQLDKSERQNVRQQVYSYCNEQLQAGEEIELESLSKELAGVSEVSFQEFTAEKGYELEESFPADRSTLRQLTKFAGSGGGLTINFDAMLLGERIFWDPATDTLTIKGTPPNLRDQLQRRTTGGKKPPPKRGFFSTCLRLRANEVDVSQFWLERVTLNSLNFHFFFFTANNDGQNFAVEFSFGLQVPHFVVIQFDRNWSSFATVNDSRELVSGTQAAARTLTLHVTYFCFDSEH